MTVIPMFQAAPEARREAADGQLPADFKRELEEARLAERVALQERTLAKLNADLEAAKAATAGAALMVWALLEAVQRIADAAENKGRV